MSLAASTRSEITKQFTTAGWWILGVVLVGYVAFTAAALAFTLGGTATGLIGGGDGLPQLREGLAGLLYSLASSVGYVFPLLIGTLIVTVEFRHKTLTPTFLATPRRGTVMWAKILVGILLGVLYAAAAIIATVGTAAGVLAGLGLDTELGASDTWALLGRIVIAFALWTLVGVGVGTLVRNQVAAIVIVLAFTQFVEPIARLAGQFVNGLSNVTNYLPGAASDALVGASVFSIGGGGGTSAAASMPLEWWAGGLVLAAYAVVFLILGHILSWRRDVS